MRFKPFVKEIYNYIRWVHFCLHNFKTTGVPKYNNRGKRVVSVGNGPSAGDFPYEKFKNLGYDFMCVNFFALDKERFFKLRPTYYCCIDNAFGTIYENLLPKQKQLVGVLEQVDWPMIFVCFKGQKLPIQNDYIIYHYINANELKGKLTLRKKKLYDRNKATFGYQNVMLATLYYFIMSRTAVIILTGVENDWHRELFVDRNNDVFRKMTHFYGNERINITQLGEIRRGELYKYFHYYYITLLNYSLAAKYASASDVRIINSCEESYIDVFVKQPAEEICL